MIHLDEQSIRDLGFDTIRQWLESYAVQPAARLRLTALLPVNDQHTLRTELGKLAEWIGLRQNGVSFPAISFEEIGTEIHILGISDGVLTEEGFARIYLASNLVNELIRAFEGIEASFPQLWSLFSEVTLTEAITSSVGAVFDQKWNVRDEASPALREIRSGIAEIRRQIGRNFNRVMKDYSAKGYLGDTGESYLNNRRVLAVYSTHKRKVPGIVVGSSSTGSLTYIEPEINIQLNFELEALHDDERNEIRKILRVLTRDIRRQLPLLEAYQVLLTELDFIQAKGRLAAELNGMIPVLADEAVIDLKQAYHPILWMNNRKTGRTTYPQSLRMDKFSRMLVISGPNAGGKSITMKTIGLLQIMFQSALAVPVAEGSELGFFSGVLTDIGDNQSIENQLSTYSYRLKRMNFFLRVANRKTLVLLDEFGTGSDPDLGGALAEVFFEELYNRKVFGVITTHYGNIKLKAARLHNAVNGCMLFNRQTLEPTYRLSIGQPGSSFTFEVAEMNGIPHDMIEEAKKRLTENKVNMDQLLSSLQSEKTRLEELSAMAQRAGEEASRTIGEFDRKRERYEEKLSRQSETIERNNKYLSHGKRMAAFIEAWNLRTKNKELLEEIRKYLVLEKSKVDDERKQKAIVKKLSQSKEKQEKVSDLRDRIKVGSLVRLSGTKQTGSVLKMEGAEVTVAIGVFRTRVTIDKLDFIR